MKERKEKTKEAGWRVGDMKQILPHCLSAVHQFGIFCKYIFV